MKERAHYGTHITLTVYRNKQLTFIIKINA